MARIRYVRGPGEDDEITVFGKTFEDGKYVEVDDKLAEKARGNPAFEVEGDTKGEPRRERGRTDEDGPEADERRQRAVVQRAGQAETQKARQAEAKASGNT